MNAQQQIRIFKSRWFEKFARREGITDATLIAVIVQANSGLVDADLGGGLIKLRVARHGEGKSGSFRTIIFFRRDERAVFAYGFAKSDREGLDANDLRVFKQAARIVLALTPAQLDAEVRAQRLFEVGSDAQGL